MQIQACSLGISSGCKMFVEYAIIKIIKRKILGGPEITTLLISFAHTAVYRVLDDMFRLVSCFLSPKQFTLFSEEKSSEICILITFPHVQLIYPNCGHAHAVCAGSELTFSSRNQIEFSSAVFLTVEKY